jgi:hypothetical protein
MKCSLLSVWLVLVFLLCVLYLTIFYKTIYPQTVNHVEVPSDLSFLPSKSTLSFAGSLLFMSPSYTFLQFESLKACLRSLTSLCDEGNWNVTIYLQVSSNLSYTHPLFDQLRKAVYCSRGNYHLPIVIHSYGQIGFGLNSRHRWLLSSSNFSLLYQFDYFIFSEEDMIFSWKHFQAYLQSQSTIQEVFSTRHQEFTTGFLRYELDKRRDNEVVTWEYARHQVR